ncbi:putative C2 domain-containing protein [Helianthus anomalus]
MTSGGGVLEVVLVDSEGIRDRKFLGCIACCTTSAVDRPYVCVEYGDQKRISKVAEGKGKKSIWDQKFNFEIENPIVENKSFRKLVLRVMDKHKLSDDGYVGEATIHVKDVVLMGMEKGEAELGSRKYRVVREDKSYTGDISAAISFKRKNGDDKEVERKASVVNNEDSTKIPDA